MLKKIICTFLLIILVLGISAQTSAADRYKWITSTDKVTISYDTQTVRYNSNYGKTVDVWILWDYTPAGAADWVNQNRQNGYWEEAKWDKFSYSKDHWMIAKGSIKVMTVVNYDVDGNVLSSYTYQNPNWGDVVPGSVGEAICNTFIGFLKS